MGNDAVALCSLKYHLLFHLDIQHSTTTSDFSSQNWEFIFISFIKNKNFPFDAFSFLSQANGPSNDIFKVASKRLSLSADSSTTVFDITIFIRKFTMLFCEIERMKYLSQSQLLSLSRAQLERWQFQPSLPAYMLASTSTHPPLSLRFGSDSNVVEFFCGVQLHILKSRNKMLHY